MVRTVVCCVAVFIWDGSVTIDEDVVVSTLVTVLSVIGEFEERPPKVVLDTEMVSVSDLVVASVEMTSTCVDMLCVALAVVVVWLLPSDSLVCGLVSFATGVVEVISEEVSVAGSSMVA